MGYTATFTLHNGNIDKMARHKMGRVLSVLQSRERSLMLKYLAIPILEHYC